MGRRAKDKQLVNQASRRRTVLQIDRVSRREVGEIPVPSVVTRAVNPNSITGIGLLGSYADHSDEEENDEYSRAAEGQNGDGNMEEESAAPSTSSAGAHSEIDAKLADFFNEIASMDADTTSAADNSTVNRQSEEAVSSTTEGDRPMMYVTEGYEDRENYISKEADMYPWQACLDETTNCYYYWNVETNEVQWHPPEQLSAPPDTQTVDDSQAVDNPSEDGYEEEQGHQEDEDYYVPKEADAEEKIEEDSSENENKDANSKDNSDDDLDGFQVIDSWQDQNKDTELSDKKKAVIRKLEKSVCDEEVPEKKIKLVEVDEDSDDDFAAQLLEDTYEKGKQDVVDEQSMNLPDEEQEKEKDEDTDDKPLLPPEVFKHLKTAAAGEKKEEKPLIEERKPKYNTEEEDYRLQILDLTSVLSNKLDFLEVSRKGVSSLKILLIEMETRISDWREGALDSRHLVHKLFEADKQLKKYEESAAPPGWTCHWDRTHKRYYYTNRVTGDSQWEYPSEEFGGDMDVDAPSEQVPAQISVAAVTSSQESVPVWSYPAYVPMVQAPVMPVVMVTTPVVSSSVKTESFVNPPVPGTEGGSEAIPFTASSYSHLDEESPPPPPGTNDLPPLPPVESSAPPLPPPEPSEAPPPPPGEEFLPSATAIVSRASSPFVSGQPTVSTLVTKPVPLARSLVDYSDLDTASASPPPSTAPEVVPQITGTQMSVQLQEGPDVGLPSAAGLSTKTKVKKKKKASKVGTSLLSSKARKVSSLVQKWQSIKQQEEPVLGSSEEEEEDTDPVKQIEEWKKEHLASGQAAYNPNFEEIKGDWRERMRQRRSGATADQKDT